MSAPEVRRRWDRLMAFLVRATSLVVLLTVTGMLLQMVIVATPLVGEITLEPVPLDNADIPLQPIGSQRPDWVPQEHPLTVWLDEPRRRVWVAADMDGQVFGREYRSRAVAGNWWSRTLTGVTLPEAPDFIDLLPASGWVLAVSQSGSYWVQKMGEAKAHTGRIEPHRQMVAMPGHRSFLLVTATGVDQVHVQFDGGVPRFRKLRSLSVPEGVEAVAVAPAGQKVLVLRSDDRLLLWHTTSARVVAKLDLPAAPLRWGWLAPEQFYVAAADGQRRHWRVDSSRESVTFQQLFRGVHYEGYDTEASVWQPISSISGQEPKFGLIPLLLGTFKAAFIALLLAVPLAIGSAVYVGFFLSPTWRERIKPAVELIAAFPAVVIGGVVAVWLAPRFFDWLGGMIGALVTVPVGIALLAGLWRWSRRTRYSSRFMSALPVFLLPMVLMLAVLGFSAGEWLEARLFAPSFADWLYRETGTVLQHRNAVLVGMALGFAIIPTIFTVAEDAIHAVPRSVSAGSLALGATHWQSFRDVVLPVAMPGIIAALMLGFGRAMGETMILLLVSGNTPIADWNLLQGVRTVGATLAIELPEATVASVHYRVLFFAALLLFFLTFICNTVAQLFKRRLRKRYGLELG